MRVSRLQYYFLSIPTLLRGFRNWPKLITLLVSSPRTEPIVLRLNNGLAFHVRTLMDAWIIKETCLDEQYEQASTKLTDGWIVIDIGAGLGDFAISVAKKYPQSLVYAYEPFPESFTLLQENLKLNNIQNVQAFPYAIGSEEGTLPLRCISKEPVQHTTTPSNQEGDFLQVPSITLEQIFSQLQLPFCHYLKMDCEGAEYDILFNTDIQIIQKIQHICLEYHNGTAEFSHTDLMAFFERCNFQVKITPNPVHADLGYLYAANSAYKLPETNTKYRIQGER